MQRGALKAFVTQHANLSVLSVTEEARRLLPLAKKARLATTEGSIAQVIYRLREMLALKTDNGNGTEPATARAELVRSDDLQRDLVNAREHLTVLAAGVQAALDVLTRIEAETQRRREHLERFVTEWL